MIPQHEEGTSEKPNVRASLSQRWEVDFRAEKRSFTNIIFTCISDWIIELIEA